MTERIAESLSNIDPNMDSGLEGKAFIRKMYKLRGEKADAVEFNFPETPDQCMASVAGKVIQIEDLED